MGASPFFSWQHAILKSKLEPTTKHVCLTIGCHMAADGSGCFPSYATIAEESGLGRSTVIMHVQKATEAGYLAIDARTRENGSTTSNLYRPTMPGGVQQLDGGSPAAGLGEVQDLDPRNRPSEQTKKPSPLPPAGAGVWEDDETFMQVAGAYAKGDPARTDHRKAFEVWTSKGLKADAAHILRALPAFQASKSWKDGYTLNLSRWLAEGAWKQVAAGGVPPEVRKERDRITSAGIAAHGRIDRARMRGEEPTPADLEAVRLWREQQGQLSSVLEVAR